MSNYDQSNQNVNGQYNAGRDIVIVSKLGKQLTLKVKKKQTQSNMMMFGSLANVEFELDQLHTFLLKAEQTPIPTLRLYIDGEQVFRREILNPFVRVEFPFMLETIDCDLIVKGYGIWFDVKVIIGGYEIISI